eukprot:TRINITY_DN777978_c0_g1_i1.p1 TRINITY_DN777978_c0_g1~~TRINITY_DN777978_c0_g1_i1.p1  ORF type:complete len:319 (+),score=114.52 TRINITY_DN777978_c0_g1_i1:148-1104(+)
MSAMEQLMKYSTVVADTGDFESIKAFKAQDGTTNPSLIFQASQKPEYAHLVKEAIDFAKENAENESDVLPLVIDMLSVRFGMEILKIVPGYVSTEVDARLSFDTEATIARARRIIGLYEKHGIDRKRVLIKIATTWEGVQAAKVLELEGITCNLTLLFSFCQAVIAGQAGVKLISPFVGRILDYFKKATGRDSYPAEEDPGVLSVREIFNYYKKHGIKTIVMGASFRNVDEILGLAGCDRLTIAPKFLKELSELNVEVKPALSEETVAKCEVEKMDLDEKAFRWMLNEDPMATEKLAHGIRSFSADLVKLENFLKSQM